MYLRKSSSINKWQLMKNNFIALTWSTRWNHKHKVAKIISLCKYLKLMQQYKKEKESVVSILISLNSVARIYFKIPRWQFAKLASIVTLPSIANLGLGFNLIFWSNLLMLTARFCKIFYCTICCKLSIIPKKKSCASKLWL